MRISITDRCNLRCQYCMPPEGIPLQNHGALLRYEELLRIAAAAVDLGITRFKITGGEPLARKGSAGFIRALKRLPGVEQVTLTTNGLLLPKYLRSLTAAGLDAVNISLDTLDGEQYRTITRTDWPVERIVETIELCSRRLPVKINAVLLPETEDQLIPLAKLAERLPVDVRFIEQMPIGAGRWTDQTVPVLAHLQEVWPDLAPTDERRGNGPAVYYAATGMKGQIGMIQAVSHRFCSGCNRIRLTSMGVLEPCLCYGGGADLRKLLRNGCDDATLVKEIAATILKKPEGHHFDSKPAELGQNMSQIGG